MTFSYKLKNFLNSEYPIFLLFWFILDILVTKQTFEIYTLPKKIINLVTKGLNNNNKDYGS